MTEAFGVRDRIRPVIGVPTQTLQAIDGIPEGLPHSWVMNHRYFTALVWSGAVPLMVPLLEDGETLREIYLRLDGLFLAGGVDMDPASYDRPRHELTGRTDPARDDVELRLTRWAMAEGMPVFGVCRGMQVINVAVGGTLVQDTTALFPGAIKHDYFPTAGYARDHRAHEVEVAPATRLHGTAGARRLAVNSMHHQGVELLGEGLVATAHAPDGLVEAVEGRGDAYLVGVQWHPEMLLEQDAGTQRLFATFIEAAADFTTAMRNGNGRPRSAAGTS
jgi:putative glutamine amidotransferase